MLDVNGDESKNWVGYDEFKEPALELYIVALISNKQGYIWFCCKNKPYSIWSVDNQI